ncbi:GTPase HflX [Tepidibacillus marianensis]|uniref:GTPase HflX n=1 Tax=Tepidibacillus marianensis TaxID=3131995 RepID=UPI0030D14CA4
MQTEKERAILVGVYLPKQSHEKTDYSLEELARLADTANVDVALTFTQQRPTIDTSWYIGKGKIEELAQLIEQMEIDLVIFNVELTPSQIRNIEQRLDCRVVDRTQLILDIFAMRANSKEGKIQVELAQLSYMLPRLSGRGEALSRLGAGIGTRGPGETKLESDRRHIRNRISELRRQLKEVVRHRELYRSRRKKNEVPQVAIVGYTNAGKSTLLNQLTHSNVIAEDRLFATLDPTSRKVQLQNGKEIIITDTVGFIQDLPHDLVASFRSTLEEVKEADLILHVVDVSHEYHEEQIEVVEQLLIEIEAHTIPRITVNNKSDQIESYMNHFDSMHYQIHVSAFKEEDLQQLLLAIEQHLTKDFSIHSYKIPAERGDLISYLHRKGKPIEEFQWNEDDQVWNVLVELNTIDIKSDLTQFETQS